MSPAFGLAFGTVYDVSTVAILALAGLSFAMTLASWIPPYLARLGMEFNWSVKLGVLVWLFTGLKFAVTAYFGADVDAHRAAYLTGVLAVFAFAALAATVDVWQRRQRTRVAEGVPRAAAVPARAGGVRREPGCGSCGSGRSGRRSPAAFVGAGAGRVDRQPGVALDRVAVRRVRVRRQGDRARVGAD